MSRSLRWMLPTFACCCAVIVAGTGCADAQRLPRQGRTAAERRIVVVPRDDAGKPVGKRRNAFFDRWNQQIVLEDVAVSTVFFGDSITEWWNLAVYFRPTDGLIENRGANGDQASLMLRRLEADVIQLRPRNVVILAGTNDVAKMVLADKDDEEIVREVTASIEALMKATRAAHIHTLVGSILPTNSVYIRHGMKTGLRGRINENLKAACAANGCVYVDYAAAMSDANGDLRKDLSADGIHPNSAGYRVMATVLTQAMAARRWRL